MAENLPRRGLRLVMGLRDFRGGYVMNDPESTAVGGSVVRTKLSLNISPAIKVILFVVGSSLKSLKPCNHEYMCALRLSPRHTAIKKSLDSLDG